MGNYKRILFLWIGLGLVIGRVLANNLQVSNVSFMALEEGQACITFDISWENSWRYAVGSDPLYLHDAAWVFFKFQTLGVNNPEWKHIPLAGSGLNPEGYATGSGTPVELFVPEDRVGLFIRRSAEGSGTNEVEQVKVVFDLSELGVDSQARLNFQVFGIEMVYVAEGSFKVGDGTIGAQLRKGGTIVSGELATPFAITNGGPIECGNESGKLWSSNTSGASGMGGAGMIPAEFPNGFNGFYCMKYEITQGQFVGFLNTLTRRQQEWRFERLESGLYMHASDTSNPTVPTFRNYVQLINDPGDPLPCGFTVTTPDLACSYLSWGDVAAFADWAGMRPMTDLEFEKACRGPQEPVLNEYAWGTDTGEYISSRQGTDNSGTYYFLTGRGHWSGNSAIYGPLRVGVFARPGSDRVSSGASYWGIMDLSGNQWEAVVTIGNSTGRAYTGLHGDGELDYIGNANVELWPGYNGTGSGRLGGSWTYGESHARVSARNNVTSPAGRHYNGGGRVVRSIITTPKEDDEGGSDDNNGQGDEG